MNESMSYKLNDKLKLREQNGNLRSLKLYNTGIDFCSNDYRGWAKSGALDRIIASKLNSSNSSLSGSTGSRLISGNSQIAENLERRIAQTHDAESALLFGNGYIANLGVIGAVCDRHTSIVMDEFCHASMIDAAHGTNHKSIYKFKHNDVDDLNKKLAHCEGDIIVLIESVYSMDGDEARIESIVLTCRDHKASLIIDEAHAIGVLGENALGLAQNQSWNDVILARIYTYGKAMACHGAAVVGSKLLIDYLINFSRPFIYTTAPPKHQLLAIDGAYDLLQTDEESMVQLRNVIDHFQKMARQKNIEGLIPSNSAIQVIIISGNDRAVSCAQQLVASGFMVKAILSPTVPEGLERIRICLHSLNNREEINLLLDQFKEF